MRFQFTPAAERALQAAAGWTSGDDLTALDLPELLIGLLDEPECRAARMLAFHGVDRAAVCDRWSMLRRISTTVADRAVSFSAGVSAALRTAEDRLWDYPRPLALATEHLLLGIVAQESELAFWLRSCGLIADELEADIHRLAGHDRGPLMMPEDEGVPVADWNAKTPSPSAEHSIIEPPTETAASVGVFRILDAAANRASEGLRVVEDYVRFALDDRHLTQRLKSMRHELTAVLNDVSARSRLAARESLVDVGATVTTTGEFHRPDVAAVVAASFQRLQQALRSLEEFTKLTHPAVASRLEKLRYAAYTLERAVDFTRDSLLRLAGARLYVLLDGREDSTTFCSLAESLVAAGVHIVQLREKSLDDRTLLARARMLREITRGSGTLFIMNDRPDIAVLAVADGVHVGQEELTVKDVRTIVGPQPLIGVSTHSIEQARQAVLDGANYLGIGPTFPSGTKQFEEFPGLDFVRQVSAEIRLPAFAIGGITPQNLSLVLQAGAERVAVAGAVCQASHPSDQVRTLLTALGQA